MSHYLLSKTSYVRGLQCHKALFFYRHYPQLRDSFSPSRKAVLSRGHKVGRLAQQLFPGGTDATDGHGPKSDKAVERTKTLIASGANVIYEAAFVYNEILVLADILVRDGAGWKVCEVKSSLRLSSVYFKDAALQYYVITGTGLVVSDFFLVHVDGDYTRQGKVDVHKLFRFVSVLKKVRREMPLVAARVEEQKKVLALSQAPDVAIGARCFSPYECDFRGQCWKNIPPGTVYDLAGVSHTQQEELYNSGYDIPAKIPDTAHIQKLPRLQVQTSRSGKMHVEKDKLLEFLRDLKGELIFLDVENFQPAVPLYDGTRPFMHLPFAYSLQRRKPDGQCAEKIFIAEPGPDPRKVFLENFLADTEGDALILSYDISAESKTLHLLREHFPHERSAIDDRLSRLRDLMQPFSAGWVYHPAMYGSVSLKSVLPALVSGFSHSDLVIQNGRHAMAVYEELLDDNDLFSIAEKKEALDAYCRMDTIGMVKIFEALQEAAIK